MEKSKRSRRTTSGHDDRVRELVSEPPTWREGEVFAFGFFLAATLRDNAVAIGMATDLQLGEMVKLAMKTAAKVTASESARVGRFNG